MSALDEGIDQQQKAPFHLRGNHAPVTDEVSATDLPVTGSLPAELTGRFVRNGPNPRSGWSSHWFDGDGMLHGIRLRDGTAEWYRNRWVRTRMLDGAQRRDPATGEADLAVGRANTHVVRHAGRMFALEEASLPNEISPDLDTLGPYDFGGCLTTPMTAHPHVCAETGEMHFFGYELIAPPFVTYHVADADGNLVHSQPIDVPGPTMVHDFALSRHYAIFLDLPLVFDLDLAIRGGMPFVWDESYGARIGLLHRDQARDGAQPTWFDVDPCFVFHIVNAWDERGTDGDVVYLDAGRHASMWREGGDAFEPSFLWRWQFDLATGTVREQSLDDVSHAFPRIDDRRTGLLNRYTWAVAPRPGERPSTDAPAGVVKYDLRDGTSSFHDFGPSVSCGEPVFVPADGSTDEDTGFLMTYLYDRAADTSSFVVLDAADMSADPIATVALPQRVPHGFHGSWFAD
jgi:carotenoid cleavage dioxygenase-like enzyme